MDIHAVMLVGIKRNIKENIGAGNIVDIVGQGILDVLDRYVFYHMYSGLQINSSFTKFEKISINVGWVNIKV